MNDKRLRGKVARILNSRELAINLGSAQGVAVGNLFDVLDPKGEDITDPESGELLGSVERPKVRVKVINVQEKLCIASTYKSRKVNVGGMGSDLGFGRMASMLRPPEYVTKYETLKTKEKTWEDLEEKESFVKTGDPVVLVSEPAELVESE